MTETPRRTLWGVGTSRTLRAHWALIELDLDYATQPIRTRTSAMEDPAFMALHPRGKIPVLVDGDLVVSESAAIVTYLAETYGSDANPLIPAAYGARAKYFEWMSFISMELDATSLYVLRRHVDLQRPTARHRPPMIRRGNISVDDPIGRAGIAFRRQFFLGHAFSGADILMISCLNFSDRYDIALLAEVAAYRERVSARPAYQAAWKPTTHDI